MTAFLLMQMDYIYFLYGMAFIMLGAVCFTVSRSGDRGGYWNVLGGFALIHGAGEWLDLAALTAGDSTRFAAMRVALMTLSFLFLLDFARLEAQSLDRRVPGRWIYALPIALVALAGHYVGTPAANAVARYTIALPATLGASYAMMHHALLFTGRARRLLIAAGGGFIAYGVAAGAIVPAAPIWPADFFNQDWFVAFTGVPIQLIRGTIAIALAISIWNIWQHMLVQEVGSLRYTHYLQRQSGVRVIVIATVILSGWALTEILGTFYDRTVERSARGDVELVSGRLSAETRTTAAVARVLARSPAMIALSGGAGSAGAAGPETALAGTLRAFRADRGFVLDRAGRPLEAWVEDGMPAPPSVAERASAIAGSRAARLTVRRAGVPDFVVVEPVLRPDGRSVGAVVVARSLAPVAADLALFERPYFLIDDRGIVRMSNRGDWVARAAWPIATAGARGEAKPMIARPVDGRAWASIDGKRSYLRRIRLADGWSVVVVTAATGLFASRIIGIIITLLVAMVVLVYLVAHERAVRDNVLMEKRVRMQSLAQDLRSLATTDPLTGLFNRLKFDEALLEQIARSDRYGEGFSLVFFDVDHFKAVNDTYGHPAGDRVLVALAAAAAANIRSSDILARWGGEEFALLAPGTDTLLAREVAEKLRLAIREIAIEGVGRVSCSFGVTGFEPGDSAETIVARADQALYRAKQGGRNRVENEPPLPAIRALA